MNFELLEYCKKEIQTLPEKKLRRPSKSPWSCAAFYVNNAEQKERGVPRLVINYKPLNKVFHWTRYQTPNKRDLLNCNVPNPHRVRTVTIKIFRNKRTKFPLKLDHTYA